LVLVCLLAAAPAPAGMIEEALLVTKRNNFWPEPFVYADRQAAREPFVAMVSNGWQRQNTLGDHHFDEQTGALTEAGRLKVLWILNEAPEQHRNIFVHRAATSQETLVRMQAVEQLVVHAVSSGPLPPVFETSRPEDLSPAERVDTVWKKFIQGTPEPKLPSSMGGTIGGSGAK
jgi:hypothetical protein